MKFDYQKWSSTPTGKEIIAGAVISAGPFAVLLLLYLRGYLS